MYKSHIALEVRILLLTGVKTFCDCGYADGKALSACSVCRGEAGSLPHLNLVAARKAYFVARSLDCAIVKNPVYEKNTATPPLPADHTLTGLSLKIAGGGYLEISFHRRKKRIRIAELRVEEDAGRLTHSGKETRMDYATAGLPSLRIRTEADFEIGEEAEVFLADLCRRIQYLEIIPGVPVESVMRCNAHISIAPFPEVPKSFVKLRNLNSFNFVRKAVNAELSRQEDILTNGGSVVAESRIWNEKSNLTESFQKRKSETSPRFVRLEAVAPFSPGEDVLEALDAFTVELPETRRERIAREYNLTPQQSEFVCDEKSRADFFEHTVALGSDPKETAQWLSSFIVKEEKRLGLVIQDAPLTPERLAPLLSMLTERRIHGGIAKQAVTLCLEEGLDPAELIRERGWEQLTDRDSLTAIVKKVVEANPLEVRRVREGDARPIRFLTGRIMKDTNGLAEPTLVKEILREALSVSLIYVLSMGGAISGKVGEDGAVEPGDEKILRELLSEPGILEADGSRVRFESIQVGRLLSEEITPSDWAALITAIVEKLNSGTANGIVVAHGTDTLPYTAPLIYWLFSNANAPIVFASSSTPPPSGGEASASIRKAVELATIKKTGVYVVHDGEIRSPLNLKFEKLGQESFRNWNMETPVFTGPSLFSGPLEADQYVIRELLEEAVNSMCVIRLYPGLRAEYLTCLMDQGVKNFFLELYDTGTASFREGPYSLKRAFAIGRKKGVQFYCTSQQEAIVDFAGYSTSRKLWKEGAVPMGPLTTESAVARFLAVSLVADDEEERKELMEGTAKS